MGLFNKRKKEDKKALNPSVETPTDIDETTADALDDVEGQDDLGQAEDVKTEVDASPDDLTDEGRFSAVKKYSGVDFNKMSKEKMFSVIYELILENKKLTQELRKYDDENNDFHKSFKKTRNEIKQKDKNLEFLARKLSKTFNVLMAQKIDRKFTDAEIVNMIIQDYLKEKKENQEHILELEKDRINNKRLVEELKNQLAAYAGRGVQFTKDEEAVDLTDEDIDEFTKIDSTPGSSIAIVAIDLDKAREALGEVEYDIMEIIGKEGISLYPELLNKCVQEKGHTESKFKTALGRLEQHKIVIGDLVKTAKIRRGVRVLELSKDIGATLFKEKFNTRPVVSEKSQTIKDHGNLVHGYSILETGTILRETLGYLDVTTSRKENTIPVGGNKYWIPDIIAVNPITNKKEYFEVEFGNHTKENFEEKMTKANLKANVLRFIVPSEIVKEKIKQKIEHWKASLPNKKTSMTVSIATISELENKSYGIEIK